MENNSLADQVMAESSESNESSGGGSGDDEDSDSGHTSEDNTKPEEEDPGGRLKVEAKFFHFSPSQDGFKLKEVHKRGEREIFLSRKQASWIADGLESRSRAFGGTIRREAVVLEGRKLILIEGSNKRGVFLAIQVLISDRERHFVVIPAGKKGQIWQKVSDLMKLRKCVSILSSPHTRSYASIVRGEFEPAKEDSMFSSLQNRVAYLEAEIAELKKRLECSEGRGCSEAADSHSSAAGPNPISLRKMNTSPLDSETDLVSDPTVQIVATPDRVREMDLDPVSGCTTTQKPSGGLDVVHASPNQTGSLGPARSTEIGDKRFSQTEWDKTPAARWFPNDCFEEEVPEESQEPQESLIPSDLFLGGISSLEVSTSSSPTQLVLSEEQEQQDELSDCQDSSSNIAPSEDSITLTAESGDCQDKQMSSPLSTSSSTRRDRLDRGNVVISVEEIIPTMADFWDLDEPEEEGSSHTPSLSLQEEIKYAKERIKWEKSATKLKRHLRRKEESLRMEDIPAGFSMGEHIQIDGEIFDGLAIVKMLIPPSRAKRSRLAFHYWSSLVGRPLLRKLRDAGLDIDMDLFGKDQLVSAVKH